MLPITLRIEYADGSGRLAQNLECLPGEAFIDLARHHEVGLLFQCGGNCVCTTCHVWVQGTPEGFSAPGPDELGQLRLATGYEPGKSRLGCQCTVLGNLHLVVPPLI